jgi:hypothetical protein
MSLKQIADELAARGRYGDSELVHMSKGEVAGLQHLAQSAGGSLTINPDTGKPEAFFLAALLPTILGAAAPALGAAATGAGMAGLGGLLSGKFGAMGLGALAGGLMNKQNPLMGAITGGMGGFGGGKLAGALQGAGAGAAQAGALSGLGPETLANQTAPGLLQAQATKDFMAQPMLSQMGQGVSALGSQAGRATAMQGLGGGMGALSAASMAAAPAMDAMMSQQPSAMPEETGSIPEYDYTAQMTGDYYQPGQGTHERRYFTGPTYTRRAAEGGSIGYANGGQLNLQGSFQMDDSQGGQGFNGYSPAGSGFSSDQMNLSHVMPTGGFSPRAIAADPSGFGQMLQNGLQREQQMPGSTMFSQLFAEGGIMQLAKGGMRDGGFVVPADVVSMVGEGNTEAGYKDIAQAIPGATPIRGKDGGQADTVKTSIEGKQPARVAHGEMYIPPEAVKKAGGAKKLYAMMDKVRKQAKGDTEQIKPVDVRKALA